MKKSVRITLYVLSIVTIVAVILVAVLAGRRQHTVETGKQQTAQEETEVQNTEEAEQSHDSGQQEPLESTEQMIEETETEEEPEETTLLFAGDVLLAYQSVMGNYQSDGITGILSEDLLQQMQEADILMVNNEFPFSTGGTKAPDKQYTFSVDPKYVSVLNEMGVDIVSLANNHSLDFGKEALSDTFTTLDGAGILYAGAGESIERAKALQVIEKNGMKFGFLASSRVIPVTNWDVRNSQPGVFTTYDDTMLVQEITAAQEQCDFLTVYVHWGIEREAYPQNYQTKIAADCFAAGADLVIGAHPHCLQGIEFMDGKPVFYSLGNFIFNTTTEKTALIEVTVDAEKNVGYRMIPAKAVNGRTVLLEGTDASGVWSYMQEISVNAKIDENGWITE